MKVLIVALPQKISKNQFEPLELAPMAIYLLASIEAQYRCPHTDPGRTIQIWAERSAPAPAQCRCGLPPHSKCGGSVPRPAFPPQCRRCSPPRRRCHSCQTRRTAAV